MLVVILLKKKGVYDLRIKAALDRIKQLGLVTKCDMITIEPFRELLGNVVR